MEGSAVLVPIILSVSLFVMIAFIVWVTARARTMAEEARASFRTRMLDKFGSAPEFIAFAQSAEGRSLIIGSVDRPLFQNRILSAIRNGIVLSFLGVAFILLGVTTPMGEDGMITGVIILSIGLGFLVTGVVSRKLTRSWADEDRIEPRQLASQV